jgi:type IV secretory pathway VirJ component
MLARISSVSLLGLSETAAFEFHVSSWLGGEDARHPTAPEVARLTVPVTCVHGADEKDSACLDLKGPHVRIVPIGSGHHFGGRYEELVALILGPAARQ